MDDGSGGGEGQVYVESKGGNGGDESFYSLFFIFHFKKRKHKLRLFLIIV